MTRSAMLLVASILIAGGVGVFFLATHPPQANPSPTEPTATSTSVGITYATDGTIDTHDWQEYRSEYGGFSVRAPKDMASVNAEFLNYYFFRKDRIGMVYGEELLGLSIQTVQKTSSSTLETWLDDYLIPGVYKDTISSVQKTTLGGFPTLQFDRQRQNISPKDTRFDETTKIRAITFPSGIIYNNELSFIVSDSSRYFVIDLGNRYALVIHTLPPYKFSEEYMLLDDKTLSDVYAAILASFQAFTPTKS